MINESAIIEYIRNNPNTNRRGLYAEFIGNSTGKQRRKLTLTLLPIIARLLKNGVIVETDIRRTRKGYSIIDSKLNIASKGYQAAISQNAKADLRNAKSLKLNHTEKEILVALMKDANPLSLTEIATFAKMLPSTVARALVRLERNNLVVRLLNGKKWTISETGLALLKGVGNKETPRSLDVG